MTDLAKRQLSKNRTSEIQSQVNKFVNFRKRKGVKGKKVNEKDFENMQIENHQETLNRVI